MADQGQKADLLWTSEIRLDLLGAVRLSNSAGDDLTPKSRKTKAILAIAALSKGPVPRSRLTDLLWGDRGEEQAKASLRQAVYELRSLSGSGYLVTDRNSVGLGPKKLSTDYAQIQRLIEAGDAEGLAAALENADCPPLADLDDIAPELDDWLRDERTRLCGAIAAGAARVADRALTAGACTAARRIADELERLDRFDERAAQLGIRADLAVGDRAAATRRHGRLTERFEKELGLAPSDETEALLKAARSTAAPTRRTDAAPSTAAASQGRWRRALPAIAALALVIAALVVFFARPSAVSAIPTVAVLPFDNLGAGKQDYFAPGVSDEILNLLGRQKQVKVLGRVSAAQLADPNSSLATARKLGVSYLLDGSVREAENRVLVIARLTRVSDGAQIWSERYERRAGDIFAVQGDIARAVATRVAQSFAGITPQQTSPEVYDRYLAARQLARERRDATLQEAERLLREAIALDPHYAPAFAELSQVIMLRADHPTAYGPIPLPQARAEAEKFAKQAISLDPNLGEAYAALGFLSLSDETSEPYYRKAVELDPQRPDFHRWHGQSLSALNRFDEAVAEYKRAVAIDPLWELNYDHLCGALRLLGRDEEASRYEQQFLRLSTDEGAKLRMQEFIADSHFDLAQELATARRIFQLYPEERQSRFKLASILGVLGERREAAQLMKGDAVATAILTGDWKAMGAAARKLGDDYFEYGRDYWNLDGLLLNTGQSKVIVDLYDAAQPVIARGQLPPDKVVNMTTSLALLQNGRAAEAQRLWARGQQLDSRMPDVGMLHRSREFGSAVNAAFHGQAGALLAYLDARSRARPLELAELPAMSLRYVPLYRPVTRDPRFDLIDERVRAAINREREKVGLPPISREAWISDPKALLTKN